MNILKYSIEGGSGIPLTPRGEQIIRYLMAHPLRLHDANDIARAAGCMPGGRAVDSHISAIRQSLGPTLRNRIIMQHGNRAYGWIDDPVKLVPLAVCRERKPTNTEGNRFAVKSRVEVAAILGVSVCYVAQIERKALCRLRASARLREEWDTMLEHRERGRYDPFHKIWLFHVAEDIRARDVAQEMENRQPT
jgi:hypothetical protein